MGFFHMRLTGVEVCPHNVQKDVRYHRAQILPHGLVHVKYQVCSFTKFSQSIILPYKKYLG